MGSFESYREEEGEAERKENKGCFKREEFIFNCLLTADINIKDRALGLSLFWRWWCDRK